MQWRCFDADSATFPAAEMPVATGESRPLQGVRPLKSAQTLKARSASEGCDRALLADLKRRSQIAIQRQMHPDVVRLDERYTASRIGLRYSE
jgi:hypothetical protein